MTDTCPIPEDETAKMACDFLMGVYLISTMEAEHAAEYRWMRESFKRNPEFRQSLDALVALFNSDTAEGELLRNFSPLVH